MDFPVLKTLLKTFEPKSFIICLIFKYLLNTFQKNQPGLKKFKKAWRRPNPFCRIIKIAL